MANLLPAAVTENGFWVQFGGAGARRKVVDATLVLTGQGGGTNLIPASLFDMTKIDQVINMRNASGKIYDAAPDTLGAGILIAAATATTAAQAAPAFKFLVSIGTNGAGTLTVTGIASTDHLVGVVNITGGTPATVALTNFTVSGTNSIAQAAGAGDTSAVYLLFIVANAAAAPTTTLSFAATDVTDTVRCLIIGPQKFTAQQTYVNDTVGGPQ